MNSLSHILRYLCFPDTPLSVLIVVCFSFLSLSQKRDMYQVFPASHKAFISLHTMMVRLNGFNPAKKDKYPPTEREPIQICSNAELTVLMPVDVRAMPPPSTLKSSIKQQHVVQYSAVKDRPTNVSFSDIKSYSDRCDQAQNTPFGEQQHGSHLVSTGGSSFSGCTDGSMSVDHSLSHTPCHRSHSLSSSSDIDELDVQDGVEILTQPQQPLSRAFQRTSPIQAKQPLVPVSTFKPEVFHIAQPVRGDEAALVDLRKSASSLVPPQPYTATNVEKSRKPVSAVTPAEQSVEYYRVAGASSIDASVADTAPSGKRGGARGADSKSQASTTAR